MADLKTESEPPPDLSDGTGMLEPSSEVNEKSLLRKIDAKLLPAVGILYLLSFLDRSNVGNARIEGMVDDLGMTGNQYLTGLSLYFVGYVLFEIPCNIILKRTTPRLWLPTLSIAWGIVATLFGVVQTLPGFLVARFFLGVTESGLFPGVVFYFSMWYKRRERQYRISLFFSAASLAGAFGGILAYGIGKMGGVVWHNGWRWIFILEGIATVIVAVAAYWFIENYPGTSEFLTKVEREFVQARLAADSDANHEQFSWAAVLQAFRDPNCWLLGKRAVFIAGSAATAVIGYIILLANTDPTARPGVSYLGTLFAAVGIYPATALVLSWPAINVSGQTKRSVANAMQISIGNLGAVLGTQLYRANDGPKYVVGHSVALAYLVANTVVVTLLAWRLRRQNQARAAVVEEVKDVGEAVDWKGDEDPRWRFEY
ncbi:putative transporter [Tolypocladium ophioglossoides CBS 100239]|uniref:Putative transporter n=1 Tax=Tolypocladium ophioglossoides (strain CBS 100239) TaxID=1163406 RepID=A0A0L0N8S6_TOLOC|nr:putative transporter [Tolypocladium ophioglossoides CBS 100239]